MISVLNFDAMAESLAKANDLPLDLAGKYMALIGDTPELDDAGLVVVRDDRDRELARVILPGLSPVTSSTPTS